MTTTTPRRVASLASSLLVLAAALSLLAFSFQARLAVERSDPNIAAPAALMPQAALASALQR